MSGPLKMPATKPIGTYKTTRPVLPPWEARKAVRVDSASPTGQITIELRPICEEDLPDCRRLRTQYEVMKWTSTGKVDGDLEATKTWLRRFIPPNDATTFNFSVLISQGGTEFEHIGVLGSHIISPVAHIGYMLRQEWWGKGIATAAVKGFLDLWWKLERKVVDLECSPEFENRDLEVGLVHGGGMEDVINDVVQEAEEKDKQETIVPEILFAEIESSNIGSRKVLEKCGFQFRGHKEIEENGNTVGLDYFTLMSKS